MPGDVTGWVSIVDRLDVWGLAILCAVCFWKIVRSLDHIEKRLIAHELKVESLLNWQTEHTASDRAEHRRIYDRIDKVRGGGQ